MRQIFQGLQFGMLVAVSVITLSSQEDWIIKLMVMLNIAALIPIVRTGINWETSDRK